MEHRNARTARRGKYNKRIDKLSDKTHSKYPWNNTLCNNQRQDRVRVKGGRGIQNLVSKDLQLWSEAWHFQATIRITALASGAFSSIWEIWLGFQKHYICGGLIVFSRKAIKCKSVSDQQQGIFVLLCSWEKHLMAVVGIRISPMFGSDIQKLSIQNSRSRSDGGHGW